MHKIILSIILIILSLSYPAYSEVYKVVKVSDGDTIYLDFNKNGKPDSNERVRLNGIDAFEVHDSAHLRRQMKDYNLSLKEALGLGYLGKMFAMKKLLYKNVDAVFSANSAFDAYNRPLMSVTYDNDKNFEIEILKAGLAVVYPTSNLAKQLKKHEKLYLIKNNAKSASELNLIFYDYKQKKSYPIDSSAASNVECVLKESN